MAYLGNSPLNRLFSTQAVTLGQGQTAVNIGYTPGLTLFFKNGALLDPGVDYTATNGSVVTLASPASAGDVLRGVSLAQFAVANALPLTGGELSGPLTGPASASEDDAGLIKLATTALAQALVDDTTALTPKKLGAAMNAHVLGMGQAWQNVTGSRALGVTYTNTTGRTITVVVRIIASQRVSLYVNDLFVTGIRSSAGGEDISATVIVPPGATYRVVQESNATPGFNAWVELR